MGKSKQIIPVDNCTTLITVRKAFIIFGSMEVTGPHSLACIVDHTNIQCSKSHLVKIAQVLLSVDKNGITKGRKTVGTVPGKGTKTHENGVKKFDCRK
jgi:hypothetical protein